MGSACSAQKKKQPIKQSVVVQPPVQKEKEAKAALQETTMPQSTQKEKQYIMNKEILAIHGNFAKLIDLVCIDDQLPEKIKAGINQLISIKKNTDAIIQNSFKRAQRHCVTEKPIDIVCKDLVFGNVIWSNLDKVARLLEDYILIDKDFEESYPILSTNLGQIHDSIIELADKYKCFIIIFIIHFIVRGENVSTNIPKQQQSNQQDIK